MRADGRTGGRAVGGIGLAVLLLTASPPVCLSAQDSQFSVRGLGTPGRWESVRARSTGGAFGPFDALSPLSEAPLADVPQLTATAMDAASYRQAVVGGTTTSLRGTRFPLLNVTGRIAPRLAVAAGFTTYLDRSWAVTLRDSTLLRGVPERYTDAITSDGTIADLRLAAASRLTRLIAVGAGLHLLSGSTRETAQRAFDDTSFHTLQQNAEVRYSGLGVSGSVLLNPLPGIALTGWVRADNRLRAKVGDSTSALTDLPRMAGGGLLLAPARGVRIAGSVAYRGWARAGAGAFDTWSWSAGAELGARQMPWRLGVRGGQMPFGPGPTAPTEFAVAGGTGRGFAGGRALLDVGVEHLDRKGGGLTERVWTILLSLTVRP
jgi:hypothetical protein